ncbi:MAG TPA: transglycosylase SLT domain-containing protein, partial [Longimicrobiaceae bacterium]|nr:transglycosylase SLT domain-containing protein [Longimicrobiaceae bacterium]
LGYAGAGGSQGERAELSFAAAELALALGDTAAARRELVANLSATATAGARQSATLLLQIGGLSADDRLAIAHVFERHGNAQRAAEGYRAWLASGAGTASRRQEVSLALGRALFNASSFGPAEEVLRPLHSAAAAVAREALLLTGRSQFRRGAQAQAFATLEELARRFPGSAEGAEGLYLVADLSHDDAEIARASRAYRSVADNFRGHDRAGLSLMRLAGLAYLRGDHAAAAALWEEYRSNYPRGDRWLQSTYWAARAYEAGGEGARARPLYRAVREREPLSYYALLSAERLGESFWPIPLSAEPASTEAQRADVAERVRVVDLLREAGLNTEADAEAAGLAEATGETGLLYALAEALNDRGYALRGIRIGQRLEREASQSNPRLLRILYPFPYRDLIDAEAREKGLDPFLVAALTRQESLFTRRISSPVGARGLMQIMPETGHALARGVGIDEWDVELLFNPEINVHLGTRYLAEQMERYDGSLPSVFSAYNAGPHRIDVWRRFPEFREDIELFTERIPYRETRDYVKILTRNLALYEALYGGEAPGASAR